MTYRDPNVDLDAEWERAEFTKLQSWLGKSSDATTREIEAELDARGNRSKRVLLGLLVIAFLSYALWWRTAQAANAPVIADEWDEDCLWWSEGPKWSDGTPIAAADLAEVRIERARAPAGPWEILTGVKSGYSYCYRPVPLGAAYYRLVTVTATGLLSAPGNIMAALTEAPAQPKPLLTAETVGYQQNLGANNKITLSRVASVPLGKPCTSTSLTDPFRTVNIIADRMLAVMDPNPAKPGMLFTRPRQVWAKCEAT
mgnify:CR=1 FL=1